MPDEQTIKFECIYCGQSLEAAPEMCGLNVGCPTCGKTGQVPQGVVDTPEAIQSVPMEPPKHSGKQRAIDMVSAAQRSLFIIATTGNDVSGHTIEKYLGIARGVVVRSPSITQGVLGGLKQFVGGNIESYARVCEDARRDAFSRMVDHANAMQADAVIAFRYDATEFAPGVTEVLAYGTAVKLAKQQPS